MVEKAHRSAEMVAKTLLAISQTRLITIAQVHGAAVAGGAGLMSACDFVVAAERTKIGYPETKRGLVAGLVMTFLRRQLRERDIRELLFTGDLISAERAHEIGLVNRVVSPNELENETQKIVAAVLQNAPAALASTKRLIEELWSSSVKEDCGNRTAASHGSARVGRSQGRNRSLPRKASTELDMKHLVLPARSCPRPSSSFRTRAAPNRRTQFFSTATFTPSTTRNRRPKRSRSKVSALSSSARTTEAKKYSGPATRTIDLKGKRWCRDLPTRTITFSELANG